MTSRVGQPDTDADRELRSSLGRHSPGFIMVAGAGSGKTTSLVKALEYLAQTQGLHLKRRGQQIACITYTEIAVGEILSDVGNASLFHVSTIHSFLWSVVRPFQEDIRRWVGDRIGEKITEAQARLDNPRTRATTRPRLTEDIGRYNRQREKLAEVKRFVYGTGSDYVTGVLGHDDILKIGPTLIEQSTLLRSLVAQRFPYIFVDESQDTVPEVVEALRRIAVGHGREFCLGFFGDPMQKIYAAGIGPIAAAEGWDTITKPENFRCPTSVLNVINRIRAEDDGLQQVRGRMEMRDGILVPVTGTARLFIFPADEQRTQRLGEIRGWLAHENGDPLWVSDEQEANVRTLVLVHRMAARRLGFADLYAALNDHGQHSLKDGLLDGTAWVLRPFMTFLLPLVLAKRQMRSFDVIAALRVNCPLLSKERLAGADVPALLENLKQYVERLTQMFADGSPSTIRDVLNFVRDRNLAKLDDRFELFLDNDHQNDGEVPESEAAIAFLACQATELWGYRRYVENESPFTTQQGIKGAEFDRVLVVLDDEEGDYNLFSYGKFFGLTPLSDRDEENIRSGADSVIGRTRRLFYVCCSRAMRDLAVVLFVPDVEAARTALLRKGFFPEGSILLNCAKA